MLKMLDLNIDDDSGFETERYVQSEICSATSVSSDVLNADDDLPVTVTNVDDDDEVVYTASNMENCCYSLSIVDRAGKLDRVSNGLITRQFFPVEIDLELGSKSMISCSSLSTSMFGSQWLNLKVPEPAQALQNVPVPVPVPVPPLQQAKKSRRGPRSRSSQYRGVTFYRRTGRWESHIWYIAVSI